jgi:ankyrin repeat protein
MATRKHRKSRKSAKRFRRTRSKRQRGGMDFDIPKSKADVDDILPGKKDYILPNGESLRSILMRAKNPYMIRQPTENWTGKEKRAKQRSNEIINHLIRASQDGDTEKLNEALNNGVDVNAKSSELPYGWTALHHAIENGHSEIAKMLLDAGADVNATIEEREYTPHYDNSDYVSGYQYDGMSVIRMAYFNNRIEILKMLFEKGADVNTTIDNVNNTFLHIASLRGKLEMVKMLLDAGADVNAKNDDGETAIDLAKSQWQTEVIKLLESEISRQNLRDIREAVRSGKTDMPASGKRIFSWTPGQGPNPGDFLGGKRKTRKSKRKNRKTRRK